MTDVEVRRPTGGDVPGIAALLGELGYPVAPDELGERLRRVDAEVLVAAAGEVLGVAALQVMRTLQRDAPDARITALVVREDARGRGIGRRLVAAVEARARDAGCTHLHVTTASHRAGAHAAYRALGFSETGRRFGKDLR